MHVTKSEPARMHNIMEHTAVNAERTDVFTHVSVGSRLRGVDRSLTDGSSSSCKTRMDWNKLTLSDNVEFCFSALISRLVTPLRFLQ